MKKYCIRVTAVLIVMNFLSCANLTQLLSTMQVREPTARVTGASISRVTFTDLDMLFDVEIENPNNMGISLAGFDYKIDINNSSFVQGDQQSALNIQKNGASSLPVPVKIVFADLYRIFSGIKSQDSTTYQLSCGLSFDLPVLGKIRVPVSHSGVFPLLKLPSIGLKNIKINSIGLSGADLSINLGVNNPNLLLLKLEKINYKLDISGSNWFTGSSTNVSEISPKGQSVISIPVTLNFVEMGRNIFSLLSGSSNLDYQLNGNVQMGTSWNLLNQFQLNLDEAGTVPLLK